MASTLSASELPVHERGASVVPEAADLRARLERIALRALALCDELPADLDPTQRLYVARGLDALSDALAQTAAAAGLARTGRRPLLALLVSARTYAGDRLLALRGWTRGVGDTWLDASGGGAPYSRARALAIVVREVRDLLAREQRGQGQEQAGQQAGGVHGATVAPAAGGGQVA
jgi:hypothetical protein